VIFLKCRKKRIISGFVSQKESEGFATDKYL